MRAPFVYYQENEDSGQTFSFFYKTAMMDAFFTDKNQPHYEENMIYGMQYSSLTNSSLVLELYNMTNESKKGNASFELYRIENGESTLIKKCDEKEDASLQEKAFSIAPVDLSVEEEDLPSGQYLLKYGKNKDGYVYTELEFSLD